MEQVRLVSSGTDDRLFTYYRRLADEWPDLPPLLVGTTVIEIPNHPKIRHLDDLSEQEKFALLSRCEVLIMPSAFESLSVIVLEAWAMGRPVLVNAACKVLEGQCVITSPEHCGSPWPSSLRRRFAFWWSDLPTIMH